MTPICEESCNEIGENFECIGIVKNCRNRSYRFQTELEYSRKDQTNAVANSFGQVTNAMFITVQKVSPEQTAMIFSASQSAIMVFVPKIENAIATQIM